MWSSVKKCGDVNALERGELQPCDGRPAAIGPTVTVCTAAKLGEARGQWTPSRRTATIRSNRSSCEIITMMTVKCTIAVACMMYADKGPDSATLIFFGDNRK